MKPARHRGAGRRACDQDVRDLVMQHLLHRVVRIGRRPRREQDDEVRAAVGEAGNPRRVWRPTSESSAASITVMAGPACWRPTSRMTLPSRAAS